MAQSSAALLVIVRDVSKSFGAVAADALVVNSDVISGLGTADFTTAGNTGFRNPDVRFANLNALACEAAKHSAEMAVIDACRGIQNADRSLGGRLSRRILQSAGGGSCGGQGEDHERMTPGVGPRQEEPEEMSRTLTSTQEVTNAETEAAVTIAVKHWINGAESEMAAQAESSRSTTRAAR